MHYTTKLFLILIIAVSLVTTTTVASAAQYYDKGQTPNDYRDKGNVYDEGNPYNVKNDNNPYSTFQNPYDARSARNFEIKYGEPVKNFQKKFEGQVTQQVNGPYSINNPYVPAGNPYQKNGVKDPYSQSNGNNP